jgi:alcohol dehydrogenase class IV
VAIATGIDAIGHALESAVSTRRNATSTRYSAQAWRLLSRNFAPMLHDPNDLETRGALQLGAMFAGSAIEHSMLGIAHSCANPLTAHYGITHGIAVALMLPHVIRYNSPDVDDLYGQLCQQAGLEEPSAKGHGARLAELVSELIATAGINRHLAHHGVDRERLSYLAQEAARQWTAQFNPRPAGAEDLETLYREAY